MQQAAVRSYGVQDRLAASIRTKRRVREVRRVAYQDGGGPNGHNRPRIYPADGENKVNAGAPMCPHRPACPDTRGHRMRSDRHGSGIWCRGLRRQLRYAKQRILQVRWRGNVGNDAAGTGQSRVTNIRYSMRHDRRSNIHDVASAVGHASLEFRASDAAISVSGYSSVETTGELNSGVLGGVRGTATSDAGLLITVTPEVDSYVTFSGSLSIDAGGAGDGDSSGTIDFGGAGFNASLTDTAGSIARQTHLVHAGSRLTLVINANSFGFQQEKHGVTTISNAAPVTFSFAAVIASMSDADAATWRPLA
jgi:hypothetical protein